MYCIANGCRLQAFANLCVCEGERPGWTWSFLKADMSFVSSCRAIRLFKAERERVRECEKALISSWALIGYVV